MRFKILILSFLLLGLISCKSKNAYRYSEKIVKLERSMTPDIEQTESKVEKFANDQNYDSIVAVAERMEKIVDDKMQEIINMPAPKAKEAENFKQAAIRFFTYIKSIYTAYKKFGLAPTDEARQDEMNKIQDIVAGKSEAVNDLQAIQKKYADANGFKIQPN